MNTDISSPSPIAMIPPQAMVHIFDGPMPGDAHSAHINPSVILKARFVAYIYVYYL